MGPVADGAPGVEPGRGGLGQQERPGCLGAAVHRGGLQDGSSLSYPGSVLKVEMPVWQ